MTLISALSCDMNVPRGSNCRDGCRDGTGAQLGFQVTSFHHVIGDLRNDCAISLDQTCQTKQIIHHLIFQRILDLRLMLPIALC